MKIYLAGPMSGYPNYNFPAFYDAAAKLRADGWDVVSPAELDDQEDKGLAMASPDGLTPHPKKTWGDFLARDVKMIADDGVKGIIFLPDWARSKGARLEAFVGLTIPGFKFYEYRKDHDLATGTWTYKLFPLSPHRVLIKLHKGVSDFIIDHTELDT